MKKLSTAFNRLSIIITFSIISFLPQNFSLPQTSNNTVQKLNQYITDFQKNKNVASISAGILRKGKTIWLGAYGYADISHQALATPKTVYRIASISKVITAVAIMQLVEKGKIKLDEDARKYIPYFPKKKWKFTVRQILQHTAGLRSYKPGEFNSTEVYPSTKDAVGVLENDPLEYKPGTKFLYTTLGYNLLAAIIENASGINFTDYLKKNIFEPAGMSTTYPEFQEEIIMNKARGYDKNNYRKMQNAPLADLSIKFAGGGLVSTTEDLLKFANSLLNGRLIKKPTLDSMLVPTKLTGGKILESGFGFELKYDNNGKFFFGHYGFGTGFISLIAIYPKDSVAAVDLINTADRNLGGPALDLASIELGRNFLTPQIPLSNKMMEITLRTNIDSAISFYKIIKSDSASVYNLSANEFDLFGYDLLKIKRKNDALKWFKFFMNEFPSTVSAPIGLGDTYYNDGNKGLAIKFFRKALEIDSLNSYATKMIKKITDE